MSIIELVAKIHEETGRWINPSTVNAWITRGIAGLLFPCERTGAGIRVRWRDYKAWQKQVNKAKQGKNIRGRKSVVTA